MKKIELTGLIVILLMMSVLTFGAVNTKIDISHFTDYHSHAQSFYSNGDKNIAGIARIIGYLQELNKDGERLIFCGGDMVNHGTPAWSDKFPYIECYWLNGLIDAMSYGNHEGDYGRDAFNTIQKYLTYPVLCSNLIDEDGQAVYNYAGKTYTIYERNGVKVGAFSLAGSDFDSLVSADKRPVEKAVFGDRIAYTRDVIKAMKEEYCDLIVLIGHASTEEDIQLAQAVEGIDIIFGTHSHVFQPLEKIDGTETYMISPYQYGEYFSNVTVRFDNDGNKSISGELVRMDSSIPEEPYFVEKVAQLQKELESDEQYAALFENVGTVSGEISAEGLNYGESEIGNLVVDLMRDAVHANCALSTSSSFRASIAPGKLNYEGLKGAIPYTNTIYVYELSGEQLMDIINYSFTKIGTDAFSQVSGLRIKYDTDGIVSVDVLKDPVNPSAGFEKFDSNKTYKVATTNYQGLYAAGYKDLFAQGTLTPTDIDIQVLAKEFFGSNDNISGYLDGRIEFVKKETPLSSEQEKDTYKIGIFADPHYFSKELNPEGPAFEAYMAQDRKLLQLSADITEETIDQLVASDCDLIIVPGDLTKDGEKICHEEFASQIQKLSDAGKAVYVICGNHDINNPAAMAFDGDQTNPVKSVTPSEFKTIYASFGYNSAVKKDVYSLSYVVEPASWLRIIAMDSCFYGSNYSAHHAYTGGFFREETFNWILEQIKEGKEKGQIVIGFMHHGIIPHLSIQEELFAEYLVEDWERVTTEFAEAGMQLVFTGHFHAQDISDYTTEGGNQLWDVQTGSLVTYPVPYREVTISKDGRTEIESIIVTEIDAVENFGDYSEEFLYNGLKNLIPYMLKGQITNYGIPSALADSYIKSILSQKAGDYELTDLAARIVTDYYAGDENPSEEVKQAIEQLKVNENKIVAMIGDLLESYTLDIPPQDNQITINLSK
ncbi:MAG TPA: 5'-nucleotidase C-terminal domain-containing protein [Thermotogota bacterium]|nr:5'-nucleotidase C-terminal domain-containing protein [Thermotogota bacterium]